MLSPSPSCHPGFQVLIFLVLIRKHFLYSGTRVSHMRKEHVALILCIIWAVLCYNGLKTFGENEREHLFYLSHSGTDFVYFSHKFKLKPKCQVSHSCTWLRAYVTYKLTYNISKIKFSTNSANMKSGKWRTRGTLQACSS